MTYVPSPKGIVRCKWCGGRLHDEDNCPTRNLVLLLNGKPPERWDAKLPDMVVMIGKKELIDDFKRLQQNE